MDFDDAKQVGDEGERIVTAELERLAPCHGFTVIRGLLLRQDWGTAQIDCAIVDRYGVLVLECKARNGALIRGRDTDHKWTACYTSGNRTFQNPLEQTRSQEGALRQALEAAGRRLGPDYIRSAVVFVGADISQLALDSYAAARVTTVEQMAALLDRRHSFAVNAGDLSECDIALLVGILQGLNRAGNPAAEEAHAAHRAGRDGGLRSERPTASQDGTSRSHKSSGATDISARGYVERSRAGRDQRRDPVLRDLMSRLAGLAVGLAVFWWFFPGGGAQALGRFLASSFAAQTQSVAESASRPVPDGVTVEDAKAALLEFSPEVYAQVADADNPAIAAVPQGTTFSWEYVEAEGAQATVRTIALTLDASGQVVGVADY